MSPRKKSLKQGVLSVSNAVTHGLASCSWVETSYCQQRGLQAEAVELLRNLGGVGLGQFRRPWSSAHLSLCVENRLSLGEHAGVARDDVSSMAS